MPIQQPNRVDTVDAAMQLALSLAARGPARDPNPQVGCVLLASPAAGGEPRRILGHGFHRGAGTPHAEAAALADARADGADVRGATAVVTLEPCAHSGRTPSCADALLEAGVAEVVYAVADRNPIASGEPSGSAPAGCVCVCVRVFALPRESRSYASGSPTSPSAGRS